MPRGLMAEPPVEAFDDGVLHRLSELGEVEVDAVALHAAESPTYSGSSLWLVRHLISRRALHDPPCDTTLMGGIPDREIARRDQPTAG